MAVPEFDLYLLPHPTTFKLEDKRVPDFSLLFQSSPVIQIHTYAAFLALLLGGFILWSRKGSRLHKHVGKIWIALIVVVAVSSFWINGIRLVGPFSPIHILSVLALWSVFVAVRHIRAGRVKEHKRVMQQLFLFAILGAGFFTFLPGRLMYNVFFG